MSGWRHPTLGARINRDRPLHFTFDGKRLQGFEGDTVASALLASGPRILGRSFKYHRPRGLWGMGAEEPNAIFDIRVGDEHRPNQRAPLVPLEDGMEIRSVNAWPNASRDAFGALDLLHRFLPAGFYYKTFLALSWLRYEPFIRRMAGLGRVDPSFEPPRTVPQKALSCDLLVIGAGPAGLAAAKAAAEAGRAVWLVDDGPEIGGSLHRRGGDIDGAPWQSFAAQTLQAIESVGGQILTDTLIWGAFDHNTFAARRGGRARPEEQLRIRAKTVVIATGAIERPLWFANNDRPGVLSAEAALHYLTQFGVLPGREILLATGNDASYATARALAEAGAQVTLVDTRSETPEVHDFKVIKNTRVTAAIGLRAVVAAQLGDRTIPCDTILCSGGNTPTVHLWCQAGGKLDWDETKDMLVPRPGTAPHRVVGAANGALGLAEALASGHGTAEAPAPRTTAPAPSPQAPIRPDPSLNGRQWIDPQNDVTLKDVGLAAREGYTSVEHLKRYTTLGMATDQGRSSNFAGLAAMAAVTGRSIPETGTTTYRPPFAPVSLTSIAGRRAGALFNPPKRLSLEAQHRVIGAQFREYGGWLRPSVYGDGDEKTLAQTDAMAARETVAVFDASPLGKLEVIGPNAADLLDFTGYMRMSTLKPGRARYGFMLSESGVVYDDGVVLRLSDTRFIVSASSSHVDGVRFRLEDARQDRFQRQGVAIQDTTQGLTTLTVTGPKARTLLEAASLEVLDLPHMGVQETRLDGHLLRVARISFTGDLSYELSVPARFGAALHARLTEALGAVDGRWIGLEAVMILRAEKGYILIGKDTDGNTMPHDLGWSGPREKRGDEFLGKRALFTPEAKSKTRRQLVGIAVPSGTAPLQTGAHLVPTEGTRRSLGFVTSSYQSPILGRPIALAVLEAGFDRIDQRIDVFQDGKTRSATVVPACAFDPAGERLNG